MNTALPMKAPFDWRMISVSVIYSVNFNMMIQVNWHLFVDRLYLNSY